MPENSDILQRRLRRLRTSGRTWQEVADEFGGTRAQAYMVATGRWRPSEERTRKIMRNLPRELWKTTEELEAAVLKEIQTNHVGIRRAIKSRYLALHLGTTDRMIRACVNALRKRGIPICSSVGQSAGFYFPASRREYEEFKHRDYLSRIKDMQRVVDRMDWGADRFFAGETIEAITEPQLMLIEKE